MHIYLARNKIVKNKLKKKKPEETDFSIEKKKVKSFMNFCVVYYRYCRYISPKFKKSNQTVYFLS